MKNILPSILFFCVALFSLLASVFNWGFFFNSRKSRFIVEILGRNGARIFYGILGICLIGVSFAGMLGYINLAKGF